MKEAPFLPKNKWPDLAELIALLSLAQCPSIAKTEAYFAGAGAGAGADVCPPGAPAFAGALFAAGLPVAPVAGAPLSGVGVVIKPIRDSPERRAAAMTLAKVS